jgi:hypothetical protein
MATKILLTSFIVAATWLWYRIHLLKAEVFLQPHLVPYRENNLSAVLHAWCSTVSLASVWISYGRRVQLTHSTKGITCDKIMNMQQTITHSMFGADYGEIFRAPLLDFLHWPRIFYKKATAFYQQVLPKRSIGCWVSHIQLLSHNEPVCLDFYTEVQQKRNLGPYQYLCAFR